LDAAFVYIAIMFAFIIGAIVGAVGITIMRRNIANRQPRNTDKDTAETTDKTITSNNTSKTYK
jgi:hypothetical protein